MDFVASSPQSWNSPGHQILSSGTDAATKELRVIAVGRAITEEKQRSASENMEHYGLGGYQLAVIQGGASDSLLALSSQLAQRVYSQESEHQKLLELSADNAALTQQLNAYTRCRGGGRSHPPRAGGTLPRRTFAELSTYRRGAA